MIHPSPRMLLVEDNAMDVDLTLRAFARHGRDGAIDIARDGEEALACLARWDAGAPAPGLILLDLKLPRLDGVEVLRRIKAHPRFGSIPVIILTTSSEARDVRTAYALGANSYIIKPVDFERFIAVAGQIDSYWNGLNYHAPAAG